MFLFISNRKILYYGLVTTSYVIGGADQYEVAQVQLNL